MFKHIFVSTDGSRCGNAALPLAARLAATCGAQVTVAYVMPDLLGVYEGPYTRDYGHEYAQALKESQGILQSAAAAFEPGVKTLLLDGRARTVTDCLLEAVSAQEADVIVMSTHGRGWLDHLLLGSVAQGVLRHAPVPVLLVRGSAVPHMSTSHEADHPQASTAADSISPHISHISGPEK